MGLGFAGILRRPQLIFNLSKGKTEEIKVSANELKGLNDKDDIIISVTSLSSSTLKELHYFIKK